MAEYAYNPTPPPLTEEELLALEAEQAAAAAAPPTYQTDASTAANPSTATGAVNYQAAPPAPDATLGAVQTTQPTQAYVPEQTYAAPPPAAAAPAPVVADEYATYADPATAPAGQAPAPAPTLGVVQTTVPAATPAAYQAPPPPADAQYQGGGATQYYGGPSGQTGYVPNNTEVQTLYPETGETGYRVIPPTGVDIERPDPTVSPVYADVMTYGAPAANPSREFAAFEGAPVTADTVQRYNDSLRTYVPVPSAQQRSREAILSPQRTVVDNPPGPMNAPRASGPMTADFLTPLANARDAIERNVLQPIADWSTPPVPTYYSGIPFDTPVEAGNAGRYQAELPVGGNLTTAGSMMAVGTTPTRGDPTQLVATPSTLQPAPANLPLPPPPVSPQPDRPFLLPRREPPVAPVDRVSEVALANPPGTTYLPADPAPVRTAGVTQGPNQGIGLPDIFGGRLQGDPTLDFVQAFRDDAADGLDVAGVPTQAGTIDADAGQRLGLATPPAAPASAYAPIGGSSDRPPQRLTPILEPGQVVQPHKSGVPLVRNPDGEVTGLVRPDGSVMRFPVDMTPEEFQDTIGRAVAMGYAPETPPAISVDVPATAGAATTETTAKDVVPSVENVVREVINQPTGTSGGSRRSSGTSGSSSNGYESGTTYTSTGRSSPSRRSSKVQASGEVDDFFDFTEVFGRDDGEDLVLDDFVKDYDGDGKIGSADRKKAKSALAAAKRSRRSRRRGQGRMSTSVTPGTPIRSPSPLRSQILATLDESMLR